MLNSDVLEVATGLVFIYLVLSLVTTSARESLEAFLKDRGKSLEQGLIELFDAKNDREGLLKQFYDHPLIYSLYRGGYTTPNPDPKVIAAAAAGPATDKITADHAKARKATQQKLPSYIPSSSFALAVMDMAAGSGASALPLTVGRLSTSIDTLPPGQLREVLRLAVQTSQNDIAKAQKFLEDWYDAAMDRVSGAYKRNTQTIVFIFSLFACVALNVNSLVIADSLSQNQTLRQALVAQADATAKKAPLKGDAEVDAQIEKIRNTGLPIGWGDDAVKRLKAPITYDPKVKDAWIATIFGAFELLAGWAITAFAVTLGAPFWFDVLNKIMVVRSTVKPSEKSGDEASKDPTSTPAQSPSSPAVQAAALDQPLQPPPPAAPTPVDPADQDDVMALEPADRPREG